MYDYTCETLVKVAELGSFSQAAKALYLSSVSVKKQMDALESRVGVRLLTRSNQGVTLTEAGQVVAEAARHIIETSEAAFERARQLAGPRGRAIRVGTSFLRPCNELVVRWTRLGGSAEAYRIEIVPFSDEAAGLAAMIGGLGEDIDLFLGPCDARSWQRTCSVRLLKSSEVQVGVPADDVLAKREQLGWKDLEGRDLLLPAAGESEVLDALREEIARFHPEVRVRVWQGFYDVSAFNECAARGCLMETQDCWSAVHPSIVTLPMEWPYAIPFGIVYAQDATDEVRAFVDLVAGP